MYRFIVISITALIVLLVGATAISAASQTALPGDSLYSVKTSLEDAQLSATMNTEAKAELNMKFAEARLAEIQTLVDEQRYDEIAKATENLEGHLAQAAQQVEEVTATDPEAGAALSNELAALVAKHAKVFGALLITVPETIKPVVQTTLDGLNNTNDNVSNNDNGNDNDENGNGNTNTNSNDNDDNGNDNGNMNENGNDNDDNSNDNENDDNSNDNENGNNNDNSSDDNSNDNGNVNDNDNDDNSNDNDDNGNANNNDNEDNGNDNEDDNENDNDNDDNGNDNDDDNGNDNDDDDNDNDNDDNDNDDD